MPQCGNFNGTGALFDVAGVCGAALIFESLGTPRSEVFLFGPINGCANQFRDGR